MLAHAACAPVRLPALFNLKLTDLLKAGCSEVRLRSFAFFNPFQPRSTIKRVVFCINIPIEITY